MKKYIFISLIVLLALAVEAAVFGFFSQEKYFLKNILMAMEKQTASVAAVVKSPFWYQFSVDGTLVESGKMDDSSSPYWWLNSGGLFYLKNGLGKTIQGELSKYSKWRLSYSISNPIDTDNGYHPQNIFRLVTRSKWQSFQQEAYFRIAKDNLSASPNRNASNGILLFNRYQDSNNLYYTGVRVDGAVVIKKKINGEYYTMAYKQFFEGEPYNRDKNPDLLPNNVWIGLRSEVKNNADGTVSIKLFVDNGKTGNWVLAVEATDDGKIYGGPTILNEGYAGIRTDFMDVEFDDYKINKF